MPDNPPRADLIGFTLTHALLRNELSRLAAAFAGQPMSPESVEVIEDHLRLVTDHLVRHHQEEDEFHWPVLASRVPGAVALLDLLEAEHDQMDPLIDEVRDRSRSQVDRADALRQLTDLVVAHVDEEDRCVVPLLAEHITATEQASSMERSRAKIPAADELRVLAMMLAAATRQEQTHFLSLLPTDVGELWRLHAAPEIDRVHDLLPSPSRPPQYVRSAS
jgi:hemerythrin-like domain-containing protein